MKLSLREMFWIILVVALSLGWWVDHQRLERRRILALAERAVVDVVAKDVMPWMVGIAALDGNGREQFKKAWWVYETASPKKREQMEQSATELFAGLKSTSK